MPIHPEQALVTRVWQLLRGSPSIVERVGAGGFHDLGQPDLAGAIADRLRVNLGQYPQVRMGDAAVTGLRPPQTFGARAPAAELSYGVPVRVDLKPRLIHDLVDEHQQLALEADVEAALFHNVSLLGLPWVAAVGWRKARATEKGDDTGGQERTVATYAIAVDCRPRRRDLVS